MEESLSAAQGENQRLTVVINRELAKLKTNNLDKELRALMKAVNIPKLRGPEDFTRWARDVMEKAEQGQVVNTLTQKVKKGHCLRADALYQDMRESMREGKVELQL